MQTPPTISLTWTQLALYAFVGVFASGATYLGLLLNRKRPKAEIHESETRSDLNLAQVRHLELQDSLTAKEFASRIFQQLFEANRLSDQLLNELVTAKKEIARIPAMEAEIGLLNAEVQRARAQGFLADREPHSPNPAA